MKTLLMILAILGLSSCGSGGGGAASTSVNTPTTPDIVQPNIPGATPTPAPTPASLTYYSLQAQPAMPNGCTDSGPATGYCVEYNSKVYCWDDGIHQATGNTCTSNFGPQSWGYSYWNDTSNSNPMIENSTHPDLFTQPTDWSSHQAIGWESQAAAQMVFTDGTPKNVTCTLTDSTHLNCVDFIIDLQ